MIPGRRLPDTPTEKITQEPWTSKQVEVLRLLVQGLSNNESAAHMMVSSAT
jgi:DNA-binding NarL/FixJ family response regulator